MYQPTVIKCYRIYRQSVTGEKGGGTDGTKFPQNSNARDVFKGRNELDSEWEKCRSTNKAVQIKAECKKEVWQKRQKSQITGIK